VRAALLDDPSQAVAMHLITEQIATLTGADATWLLLGPDPCDGSYTVAAHIGSNLHETTGARLHPSTSRVLQAVEAAGSVVSVDVTGLAYSGPDGHIAWGPSIGIPLRGAHADGAVVIVRRHAGAMPFDESIAPLVTAFADQATAALDKAAQQRLARQLDVYEDRERIARDLHDLVIQRVFAAGLALQSTMPRITDADVQRRLHEVIAQLDDTVRDIRTTIFDLHATDAVAASESLRRRVLDIVTEAAGDVLQPTVRMSGAIDTLVTGALAADVEAVVREAVSNAARHSGGTHVTVTLDVGDEVVVEVLDDGRGIDERAARSGLRNLQERARRRGGTVSVQPAADGGTRLRWSSPLR
jgi:signal transduction histidine kinase